jgi:8-oxo-dGTP diphosphatase
MTRPVLLALALLVRDGRVLLAHRTASRAHYPDCWDLVGGHVEAGETPEDAVVRECLEEIGVVVHAPVRFPMVIDDAGLDVRAFVVTRWDGDPVNVAPDEHDELRWWHPDALTDLRLAHPSSLRSIVRAADAAREGRASGLD